MLYSLTSTFSNTLAGLTMDKHYLITRNIIRFNKGKCNSLVNGTNSLTHSLRCGAMSFIRTPIAETQKDGIVGLFSGIGKGFGRGTIKTLTGVFDLISDSCYQLKEISSLYRVSYNRLFSPRLYDINRKITYLNGYPSNLFECLFAMDIPYGYEGIAQYNGDIIIPNLSNQLYCTHIYFDSINSILLLTKTQLLFITCGSSLSPFSISSLMKNNSDTMKSAEIIIEWSIPVNSYYFSYYYMIISKYQNLFHSGILDVMSLPSDKFEYVNDSELVDIITQLSLKNSPDVNKSTLLSIYNHYLKNNYKISRMMYIYLLYRYRNMFSLLNVKHIFPFLFMFHLLYEMDCEMNVVLNELCITIPQIKNSY